MYDGEEMTEEYVILPAVIISDETYQRRFWNENTDRFARKLPCGRWVIVFNKSAINNAIIWSGKYKGKVVSVPESFINPPPPVLTPEQQELVKKIATEMAMVMFESMMYGVVIRKVEK